MTYDHINPNHYKGDRKYEPIDVIEDWGLNYHLGNALKYIARNGRKPGEDPRQGISKAVWYLERYQDQIFEEQQQAKDADELIAANLNNMVNLTFTQDSVDTINFDQEEVEFQAMADIPSSVLFGSDEDGIQAAQPVPFEATYEDILSFDWDVDDQLLDHWGHDTFQTFGKDLSQFSDTEIVYQSEEGGYIFGHQKNGDVRILGKHGEPVTRFDGDNAPSEYEDPLHDC